MKDTTTQPRASRPGEYTALFVIELPTMEGPAFVFMGCDAYSEFAYNTGVESADDPETFLKHVYLLCENPDFLRHRDKGFTLVLDRYEELAPRIESIIAGVYGRLLYDKTFHDQIARPVLESFSNFTKSK